MPLDLMLRKRVAALLRNDAEGVPTHRLADDAGRLFARVKLLIARGVVPAETALEPLELACHAMQLPARGAGRSGPRQQAAEAAELLTSLVGEMVEVVLLEETVRLIEDAAARVPETEPAKLLADAINLGDFSLDGLIAQAMLAGERRQGAAGFLAAYSKRDAYGYWDARLKDGFHFEAVRALAAERLARVQELVRQARLEAGDVL